MKKLSCLLILLLCVSCASKFNPYTPPDIKFEKTAYFSNDVEMERIKGLGSIALNPIYVDANNKPISPDKAVGVILSSDNYKDVGVMIEKMKSYKQLAEEEETITNLYIDINNSKNEYISLERQKAIEYRELWVNAKTDLVEEKDSHDRDNLLNKISHYLIIIGGIVLGVNAL